MTPSLRATYCVAALLAVSGLFACKPGSKAVRVAGEETAGEAGASDRLSEAGQAGETAAGGTSGGAGAGGTVQRGVISVTQAHVKSEALMIDSANFDVSAVFATYAELTREQAAATVTTSGDCTATVLVIDPKAPRVQPSPGLNAGTITVTGIGVPPTAVLEYTPGAPVGPSNYTGVRADTRFYEDGDVLTVRGAGGPDLPAFQAQSLTAPSEIAVTAPSCVTGSCPDVDHTHDLLVAWENGGAGKVSVLFETVADAKVVLLQCKFDAQTGKGVVPTALLAKLDPVDGNTVSGIMQISPMNEVTFPVGDVSTTFSITSAQFEVLFNPLN